jgi:hypothetical protein
MRPSHANLLIAVSIIVLTAAILGQAGAAPARYCAYYSDGSTDCSYFTMSSCRASVSGVGGACGVNPRARQLRTGSYPPPPPYDPSWIPPPPFGR